MNYSIIIPVFNKASFTRRCLDTLRETLDGAGDGEIIVVDNASSDDTTELLAAYSWIRVLRNEKNLGFAVANNQGAQLTTGEFLVLLNNDTQGFPGWLAAMLATAREPGVGAVGAKLLYGDRSVQHGGVVVGGDVLGRHSFLPLHQHLRESNDCVSANRRRDVQAVTGACLVTPRAIYNELGGLDEQFWNGYEDVDYCFKVRARGLRVVYEPSATLFHFESQSGVQRFRRVLWNMEYLEERWRGRVTLDATASELADGRVRRATRESHGALGWPILPIPKSTILVHGAAGRIDRSEFETRLRDTLAPIEKIVWLADSAPIADASTHMEVRGDRYLVFVHADARLQSGWLDALIEQVESRTDCAAATAAPELPVAANTRSLAADARCTLLALRMIPQHLRLTPFDTLDGAVADLLVRALDLERGTRGVARSVGDLPKVGADASFSRAHGIALRDIFNTDCAAVEQRLAERAPLSRALVSIVTLSWNAVEFTKIALDSIRAYTSEPYEVIVVDNGSRTETLEYLRAIDDPHVRIMYNAKNLGFAVGNNIGMAAARGEFVVILNNDVIVTEGWLDDLLDPFRRIPTLGVTAPRSNRISGTQLVTDAQYNDAAGIHAYARSRRATWKRSGYSAERAIGLCLCVARTVIDEVGGFDERFGLGNFEDDDWCIRIRAAGYGIYVCDDVFIHHFGSRSFVANNVDYGAMMAQNWSAFAAKWSYPAVLDPTRGYDPTIASRAGFVRAEHYVELPTAQLPVAEPRAPVASKLLFCAAVHDESEWVGAAAFAKRYLRAYRTDDPVTLRLGAFGSLSAQAIGERIRRIAARESISADATPNIEISDEGDIAEWSAANVALRVLDIATLTQRSPSALRRLLREVDA